MCDQRIAKDVALIIDDLRKYGKGSAILVEPYKGKGKRLDAVKKSLSKQVCSGKTKRANAIGNPILEGPRPGLSCQQQDLLMEDIIQ